MIENIKGKAQEIQNIVKGLNENQAFHKDLSYVGFILSLLPIPSLQQLGQITTRISDNKALQLELSEIYDEITTVNERIVDLDETISRIEAFANTVKYNSDLDSKLEDILSEVINDLKSVSEFNLVTTNWSYQEIINSIIEVDSVEINSNDNSHNLISSTEIKSNKTTLKANNISTNKIDNVHFKGKEGSIKTQGDINQVGEVVISNASIGFKKPGSFLHIRRPQTVKGVCPCCKKEIILEKDKITGKSNVTCPYCNSNLPIRYGDA